MEVGDRIRLQHYYLGHTIEQKDYTVEEFRFCLGVFLNKDDRQANVFTPLCDLYEKGPESENGYISNYGEYYTNPVQAWMDIT